MMIPPSTWQRFASFWPLRNLGFGGGRALCYFVSSCFPQEPLGFLMLPLHHFHQVFFLVRAHAMLLQRNAQNLIVLQEGPSLLLEFLSKRLRLEVTKVVLCGVFSSSLLGKVFGWSSVLQPLHHFMQRQTQAILPPWHAPPCILNKHTDFISIIILSDSPLFFRLCFGKSPPFHISWFNSGSVKELLFIDIHRHRHVSSQNKIPKKRGSSIWLAWYYHIFLQLHSIFKKKTKFP